MLFGGHLLTLRNSAAGKTLTDEEQGFIFGCMILLACGIWILVPQNYFRKASDIKSSDYATSNIAVCTEAQIFIKNNLKAPSTAKFPYCSDMEIEPLGYKKYRATGYVDAQNSFGAMVRTYYVVEMKYMGNDHWELLSLDIQ